MAALSTRICLVLTAAVKPTAGVRTNFSYHATTSNHSLPSQRNRRRRSTERASQRLRPQDSGYDSAPSPLAYNLTALSSCTQITGSIVAKDRSIDLKQWNVTVGGQLGPSVLVKGVEGIANWIAIDLRVELRLTRIKLGLTSSPARRRGGAL